VALNLGDIFGGLLGQKKIAVDGELPLQTAGEPKAQIPLSMSLVMGDQGVAKTSKVSAYDFTVSARDRWVLRKRHPYIAAVHNAIVKQAKKVELCVEAIDEEKPFSDKAKANMELFIKDGFGEDGEKELRGRLIDTKKWYGDNFAEIVFDMTTKEPVLVNYLIAETMRILPNEHGQVVGYPQVVDGKLANTFAPANIIHMKEHPDEYSFFGFSDLDALFGALLLDVMADEYSTERLKNDSSHGGIGVFEGNTDAEELGRLRWAIIKQMRQAPGKPLFINGLKQWIPTGVNPKDMDWQELHRSVKEKVMMVYSVLPMQVAVVETGKLANPEQQLEIGEEYIKQELEAVQNFYNLKLTPFFKDSANLHFKFSEVQPKLDAVQKEALIDKTKAETAAILAGIGEYTKDEIREITGHPPLELGGEELHVPPTPLLMGSTPPGSQGQPDPNSEDEEADQPDMTGAKAHTEKKALVLHKASRAENAARFKNSLGLINARFTRQVIALAKAQYPNDAAAKTKSVSAFETMIAQLVSQLHRDLDASVKEHAIKSFKDSKTALGAAFNHTDEHAISAALLTDKALDAVQDFTLAQREGFKAVIVEAFDKGLDERAMVKEMRNFAETETYRLERIARTESNKFANRGRFAGYKDLEKRRGEEYEYEWVGPEDERTSEICQDIKQDNPYDLGEIMKVTDGGEPHINCRHNVVRVVK
jgi:SPP1 gp7 family putative phage head morphogenesis protein